MHDEEMASDPSEFWDQRHDLTPSTAITDGDDSPGYRLALLADITDADVRSGCARITDSLAQFECFDTAPPSTHHLTIKLFDAAVDPSTTRLADSSPAVRRVDRAVSSVVAACDPFEVELTQFNLFPDIVYGEVADGGRLADLNRRLCDQDGISTLDRDEAEFIPHLTFGYFGNDTDYEALLEYIETNRELPLPTLPVEVVALVAYEVGGRPPTYNQLETYEL